MDLAKPIAYFFHALPAEQQAGAPARGQDLKASGGAMASAQILVVEDEGVIALYIQGCLNSLGYTVAGVAASKDEAIRQAAATRPNLVLMDIKLGGKMNGIEAARQIRADFDIPIVYVTALSNDSTLAQALETGPFGYITKPFEPKVLQSAIEMALYKHNAEKRLKESEARFRLLVNSIDGIAWEADATTFQFLFVSQQAERLLGYPLERWVAEPTFWQDHLYPDDREWVLACCAEAIAEKRGHELEYRMAAADGRIVWLRDTVMAIVEDDRPKLRGLMMDITHRKQAEEENKKLNERLERRVRELAALNKAGQAVVSELDRNRMLELVIEETRELLGVEAASILLCEPACDELVFAAAADSISGHLVGLRMPIDTGLAGWVVRQRQPVMVNDAYSDPRFYRQVDAQTGLTTRSLLAAPLMIRDEVVGVVEAINKVGGQFTSLDLEVLETMAGSAAIAIENARLFQAEREQRELAETLREVGATLVSTLAVETVLDRILEQVSRVVPHQVSNVMLIEEDQVRVVRSRGYEPFDATVFIDQFVFPLSTLPIRRQMLETRQPVVVPDIQANAQWINVPKKATWLRSYVAAPICVQDQVIGFLNVGSAQPGAFRQEHAQRLRVFAHQAAIAFQNARHFEELQAAAAKLQALSRRLVEVQEAERRNIARELHDEIGQLLTGLKLSLSTVMNMPPGEIKDGLKEALALASELVAQVRELSLNLRPAMLDDLGLLPALLWLFERYTAQTNVRVIFRHTDLEGQRFAPELETAVYRITQEALTNAARHAQVDKVAVRLWANPEALGVQVEDGGVGFEPEAALAAQNSSGLAGMRERANLLGGQLLIESSPGAGARLTVMFPLGNQKERAR